MPKQPKCERRTPQPQSSERIGLECRACGCRHFLVVYTRERRGGGIVRRRECRSCGKRIVTVERAGTDDG